MSEIDRIQDEAELEADSGDGWNNVVVVVALGVILAVSVIAVLALIGPSIGNVYSNIVAYG